MANGMLQQLIARMGRMFGSIFSSHKQSPGARSRATTAPAQGQAARPASRPVAPPPPPRANKTLDLEASQFLPIGRDELLVAAKGTRRWGNVWFGRRDLIPPADDARTLLVDRGMVTEGLISPEELAEIHRVGAEMDLHRPAQAAIQHQTQKAGQAAVDELRAEKARIKAEKTAESAARKAARQAAIDHRRANDIVFLGRRVSGKLGHRESDPQRLQQLDLPVLQTPADVSVALQISISQLRWLAFHAEVAERTHYVYFEVPKKSGGFRRLSSPHAKLAAVQRWILEQVLNKLPTQPAAHGFIAGRNILSNATPHVNQSVLINMDLENFFPNITFPRVRKMFARLGYSGAVSTILALLCTECPRRAVTFHGATYQVATGPRGLPQGACTSPSISNQVAVKLDRRLQGLANKMELNYTRYADDLTLSGGDALRERVGYVMARVRHFAEEEGFRVNNQKSRVQRRNSAQVVTGLVVNERPTVSREKIRRIRAILHRAQTEGLEAQNRQNHPYFRAWLEGYIAFIAMTRPELAAGFRAQLSQVR
jgi:RNA-directed DNA polymerase